MDFALLPPEINSGRMYSGPGAGPMLAAAAAWDTLAGELESAAVGYASVVSGLTSEEWSGPAAAVMASAAAPYAAWLQASSTLAERTAMQAKAAAAAYEAAFAATVPPPVIAANRALLAALVATNFFGQNTPAITATEAHYAEMWAQDATAMYGYVHSSSSAGTLTPFHEPPPTTNPAGLGAQAGAVAEAAATNATHGQTLASLWSKLMAFLDSPRGGLTEQGLGWINQAVGDSTNVPLGYTTAFYTIGTNAFGYFREFVVRGMIAGYTTFEGLGPQNALFGAGGANALGGLGKAGLLGPLAELLGPSAGPGQVFGPGLGQASSIGAMSVPPSWATAAAGAVAGTEPVAISLTATNAAAAPTVAVGLPPGTALQESMMGTMSGRGALSGVTDRHDGDDDKKDDNKDGERPVAALVMPSGWLASALAHNTRRRTDPDPLPLPPQWQEELAANQSAWG